MQGKSFLPLSSLHPTKKFISWKMFWVSLVLFPFEVIDSSHFTFILHKTAVKSSCFSFLLKVRRVINLKMVTTGLPYVNKYGQTILGTIKRGHNISQVWNQTCKHCVCNHAMCLFVRSKKRKILHLFITI